MKQRVVLVVEPDRALADVTRLLLESEGQQARLFPSSAGVLAAARRQRPDLLLVNTWLETREAGWELLQQLWDDPMTREIPVIVCTADTITARKRGERLRARRRVLVTQPFDVDEFWAAIERACQERVAVGGD